MHSVNMLPYSGFNIIFLNFITKEQPEVQGLSPRGSFCQHSGSPPSGFWSSYPLDCHSNVLETPQ